MNMPANSAPPPGAKANGRSPLARSRVTNVQGLVPGVDGRSVWARRLRDLIELHCTDLGGADHMSEAERSIIRRVGAITVELENLEVRAAGSSDDRAA